jgi:hypothetical protein
VGGPLDHVPRFPRQGEGRCQIDIPMIYHLEIPGI